MSRTSLSEISPQDLSVEKILQERYYVKKKNGEYETWKELCDRVATSLEAQDPFNKTYTKEAFSEAMENKEIMVGSPTLMNAGARLGMLSSCFIFDLEDSLDSIFSVVKESAKTFQHGGGIGYDFSKLRPEGAGITTTGGFSSGPLSFMKVINITGEVVKGGGLRKAAIMSTMRVDHPDIESFINIKRSEHELNNMNLSVTITDEFMVALKKDDFFDLKFQGRLYKRIKAKVLWDQIVDAAWKCAEPGIIFIDRVNAYNTTPQHGKITHPNPCSEFFQVKWNSCNLGSINLMNCYEDGVFSFKKLEYLTKLLATGLNKTIEINNFPTERIETTTKALRPIGMGVFGTANVLIKEQLRYGSEESCSFIAKIMDVINRASLDLSADYAEQYGAFEGYNYGNFRFLHEREDIAEWQSTLRKIKKYGLYNCLTTTQMPTGTVSILAGQGEANGIEPLYSDKVTRKFVAKSGAIEEMSVLTPAFEEWKKSSDNDYMGKPIGRPSYLVTKDDLTPRDHIKVLAITQKHCQTGVSKTINFPASATRDDISEAYLLAYSLGCKSVSVYRDGSRSVQILNSVSDDRKSYMYVSKHTPIDSPHTPITFEVAYSLKSQKLLGVVPKLPSGKLLTLGKESKSCEKVNHLIDELSIDQLLLKMFKHASEYEDDSLEKQMYAAIACAVSSMESQAETIVSSAESTSTFGDCPTGVCSL